MEVARKGGERLEQQPSRVEVATPNSLQVTTPPIASPRILFMAGFLGGVASTLVGHPFDTIKVEALSPSYSRSFFFTFLHIPQRAFPLHCVKFPIKVRLQTQPMGHGVRPQYLGPIHCLRTITREETFRGLFKGM